MDLSCRSLQFSPKKPLRSRHTDSDGEEDETSDKFGFDTPNETSRNTSGGDEVDGIRKNALFDVFDVAYILFSIVSYVADFATDLFVAASYYFDEHYWWFALTMTFILVPAVTVSGLSIKWYIQDTNNKHAPPVSKTKMVIRTLSLICFMNPIVRYSEALYHGLLSRKLRKKNDLPQSSQFYAQMAYEDADATFLRLFECFMESAPQLVLQLYIMARSPYTKQEDPWIIFLQTASVVTSVISLAWAMTSYNRSIRYSQVDKDNIKFTGTIVLFLHHLFGIVARVLALSLFASAYTWFVWPVCLGHWVLMATWLWLQKTAACSTRTEEFFFCLLLAVIHVFTFFNVKPDRTAYRYTFYYLVCLMENTALIVLWFLYAESSKWWYYPGLVGQVASFVISMALLIVYYTCLHPNKRPSTNIGICTKDTVCLSDVNPASAANGESPTKSPLPVRLGRLDSIQQSV